MEDFDFLENINRPEEKTSVLSNIYEIRKGGFGQINEGLDSYICSTTIGNLVDDIETFEKLTFDKSWPVSQIIQREIDQDRIKDIANHYILPKRNVKYFPPLIVVILPKDSLNSSIADAYKENTEDILNDNDLIKINEKWSVNNAIELLRKAINESQVEDLYILNVVPKLQYRLLAWDKQKYYCVVIDGQHRLESLKYSIKKDPSTASYRQDIVFIDVSSKAIKSGLTPVQAVRTIFIDINNNASPVTQARKYVMDDKDLASLFVQSLVNDDPIAGSEKGKYIEPQLIDWHADNLKHELPHLTGILSLYQLMSDAVIKTNLVSIKDLQNPRKVNRWINRLNTRFEIDEKIRTLNEYSRISTLEDSYKKFKESSGDPDDEEERDELYPFEYDYNILKIAQRTFFECYCLSIVKYFYNLKPYSLLINSLKSKSIFNPNHVLNRAVIKSNKKMASQEKKLFNDLKKDLIEKMDVEYYLVFTVLGQKTLFELYFKEIDRKISGQIKEDKVLEITNNFLEEYNKLFDILSYSKGYKIFGKQPIKDRIIQSSFIQKYLPSDYGYHTTLFWEDIIYLNGSTIIYTSQGINSMKAIIEYMTELIRINNGKSLNDLIVPNKFEIPQVKSRIKRALVKQHSLSDNVAEETAEKIIKIKKEFLDNYLIDSYKEYRKNFTVND